MQEVDKTNYNAHSGPRGNPPNGLPKVILMEPDGSTIQKMNPKGDQHPPEFRSRYCRGLWPNLLSWP